MQEAQWVTSFSQFGLPALAFAIVLMVFIRRTQTTEENYHGLVNSIVDVVRNNTEQSRRSVELLSALAERMQHLERLTEDHDKYMRRVHSGRGKAKASEGESCSS